MNYGVAPRDVPKVAVNYFTGPPLLPPLSTLLERALGVPMDEVIALTNDPRFLTAVVPAGNVVATANELSRFYQLLLARRHARRRHGLRAAHHPPRRAGAVLPRVRPHARCCRSATAWASCWAARR